MESTMVVNGYVGHSLELKQTKTGVSTLSFRVGTTPRHRTEGGWVDGPTTWTTVVCYRSLADNVFKSVHKGDPVVVQGRIRTQTWEDKQGESHERMVLEAAVVGHDLNRGVSDFTKIFQRSSGDLPKAAETPEGEPAIDDEELEDELEDLALAAEVLLAA